MSKLVNLEKLDLRDNPSLLSIPAGVCQLSKLMTIDCDECEALTSPPYAVCTQGLAAMRKYFTDLEEDRETNIKFVPVTVFGQTMAGKTSLVRSMQKNERVLTLRCDNSKLDEATKVFKVCEAEVDNKYKLVFHDFGGQAIYQFAYQLSDRSQYIPMLVIDIAEFDRLVTEQGEEVACETVCFQWLSHLYLASPKAGPPFVVLTHCDVIDSQICETRLRLLIEVSERLRSILLKEEKAMVPEKSPILIMKSFQDTSQPLLTHHTPRFFYKDSTTEVICGLKTFLVSIGLSLLTEIPGSWYVLMELCANNKQPYLTLEELDKLFPGDKDRVILQYLNEIGRIKWYRNRENLSNIVFHRIELLTHLIELLYDHSRKDTWDQRIKNFQAFEDVSQDVRINKRKYNDMIRSFLDTGVIRDILLHHLISQESEVRPEVAIEVLKVFHLICGPVQKGSESHYVIPYFSPRVITVEESGKYIPLKVDICFNGLALPSYAYDLLTAIYVNLHITPFNHIDVGCNGACVSENNGTIKYLFHDHIEKTVTLIILSPSD
jgi:hypothetical protein